MLKSLIIFCMFLPFCFTASANQKFISVNNLEKDFQNNMLALPALAKNERHLSEYYINKSNSYIGVEVSNDGAYIAVVREGLGEEILPEKVDSSSFGIEIWNINGELGFFLEGHENRVSNIEFLPNNKGLISSSVDGEVVVWDIVKGGIVSSLIKNSKDAVFSVDESSGSIAVYSEGKVKIYSGENYEFLADFDYDNRVDLFFFKNGKIYIFDGSWLNVIKKSGRLEQRFFVGDDVYSATFLEDEGSIDFVHLNALISSFNLSDYEIDRFSLPEVLYENSDYKRRYFDYLSYFRSGDLVVFGSTDNFSKMTVWDKKTGTIIHQFDGWHSSFVTAIDMASDNNLLVSVSDDSSIRIWDVNSGVLLDNFGGMIKSFNGIEMSPDGKNLAISNNINKPSYASYVSIWDLEKKSLIDSLFVHDSSVWGMSYSKNGNFLVVSSYDLTISIWRVSDYSLVDRFFMGSEFFGDDGLIPVEISISDNAMLVLGRDNQGRVSVWRKKDGKYGLHKSYKKKYDKFDFHWLNNCWIVLDDGSLYSECVDSGLSMLSELSSEDVVDFHVSDDGGLIYYAKQGSDGYVRRFYYGSFGEKVFTEEDWSFGGFLEDGKGFSLHKDQDFSLYYYNGNKFYSGEVEGDAPYFYKLIANQYLVTTSSSSNYVKVYDLINNSYFFLVSGLNKTWMSYDADGNMLRGDDGTFLLTKDGNRLRPTLPKSAKPITGQPIKVNWDDTKIVSMNSGEATTIAVPVTNTGDQTLYWVQPRLSPNTPFNLIKPKQANRLEPGASFTFQMQVIPHLPNPPPPGEVLRTLKLKMVAPEQTETSFTIQTSVKAPRLDVIEANLLKDGEKRTLELVIQNAGQQAIAGTFYQPTVPPAKGSNEPIKIDPQEISDLIQAGQTVRRSFPLPDGYEFPEEAIINWDIRNAALPFMNWKQTAFPVKIERPPLYWYALLAALLLMTLTALVYYRRYRNPLVLRLSDNAANLRLLSLEELDEASVRLHQTGRFKSTLASAKVSHDTFEKAVDFTSDDAKRKAERLAERLNATVSKTLTPQLFELKMPENFQLNINRLLVYFPDCEAQDALHQLKVIPQAEGRITVIVGKDAEYQRKLLAETEDKTNKYVAPPSAQLTNLLLNTKPQAVFASILARQLSLSQLSPYEIGGGVSKASIFFGRTELIAQIINRDPANYLVVGGRQLGKSSLLKELERRYLQSPNTECHYYSLSSEALLEPLSHRLRLPERTKDAEIFAAQLEERIASSEKRYVILIDEADLFIEHEQANGYPILNVLRRLSEQGGCHFILAGFWQLYQHATLDYQSPLKNFGEVIEVGALEEEACHDLAVKPMQSMGLSYANDAIVQDMIELCGQRANLIANVCHRLVQTLPEKQRVIEAGDVHRVMKNRDISKLFDGWLIGTTQREKAYVQLVVYSTIHKDSFSEGELIAECHEKGVAIDNAELERTFNHLELAFVLRNVESNRWTYRVPLFVRYMKALEVDVKLDNLLRSWDKI